MGLPQMLGFCSTLVARIRRDIVDHRREKMSATPSDDDDVSDGPTTMLNNGFWNAMMSLTLTFVDVSKRHVCHAI